MVTNAEEEWIGWVTGHVYWNWLEIDDFWLQEKFRNKGLGGEFLQQFERLAVSIGAKKSLLRTYEFQARAFYEKFKYKVVGEIKDYPLGSSFYTMVKSLED